MKKYVVLFILSIVTLSTFAFAQLSAEEVLISNGEQKQNILIFFSVLSAILLIIYAIVSKKRTPKIRRKK